MPNLIGDDLIFRRLLHKADTGRLGPRVHLVQRRISKEDAARACAVGRKGGLQLPQQRGLAAAGGAAEHHEGPFIDG